MAARNPQTHAKRARELALREKRERKKEKKADVAARRAEAAANPDGIPEETDDVESEGVEDAGADGA